MQLQEEAPRNQEAAVVEDEEDSWQPSQRRTKIKATTAFSFFQSSFRISKECFYFLPTGLSREVHLLGMFDISVLNYSNNCICVLYEDIVACGLAVKAVIKQICREY
jgi:hypothetical protein